MVAQLSQLTYRCPKCGDTFAADGEASVSAGCPSCRESPAAGWYLKVRGEIVGPVAFEELPEQINASAVLVRQAGEADWTPVTAVLPAMSQPAAHDPASEFGDFHPSALAKRRLLWPLIVFAVAVVALAGGWIYHRVSLARAAESQTVDGGSGFNSRDASPLRRDVLQARNGELGTKVRQLERQLAVADYRRQLLIEVIARQERRLASQVQQLQTMTRSRRSRRFRRGFEPPDEAAEKTLMTDFRRRLALAWAAKLAKRRDAAAESAFLAAEVKRLSGAPVKTPLQPHDRELLKQNGVKYRTRYNGFYTAAHKELTLYMDYATAEELVLFASHERLSLPSGQLPADFAAAVMKLKAGREP